MKLIIPFLAVVLFAGLTTYAEDDEIDDEVIEYEEVDDEDEEDEDEVAEDEEDDDEDTEDEEIDETVHALIVWLEEKLENDGLEDPKTILVFSLLRILDEQGIVPLI